MSGGRPPGRPASPRGRVEPRPRSMTPGPATAQREGLPKHRRVGRRASLWGGGAAPADRTARPQPGPLRGGPALTGVDLQAALGTGDQQAGPVVADGEVGGQRLRVLGAGGEAHLGDQWPRLLAAFGRRRGGALPERGRGSLLLRLQSLQRGPPDIAAPGHAGPSLPLTTLCLSLPCPPRPGPASQTQAGDSRSDQASWKRWQMSSLKK